MSFLVRIVVQALPASWGWRAKSDGLTTGSTSGTPDVRGQAPKHYYYNANQSADIWLCSMPYQAREPDPASS